MDNAVFDTAPQPLLRRGDYWLDEVCARHIGVFGKTHVCADPSFYGRMQLATGEKFAATVLTCSAGVAFRRPHDVRRKTHDRLVISIERGAGAVWRQRGRELQLGPGDILITNPDEPYVISTLGDFNLASFYVPRAVLQGHLCPGDLEIPRVLRADQTAVALAGGFGIDLADKLSLLDQDVAAAMVDSFARLVAVASGATASVHGDALQRARLEQALRHIDGNLTNSNLSPASCARAIGVSVRTLHLVFEPTGRSFTQTLLSKRLELCRATLCNPVFAGRQVSDIAFAYGFGSLAGFYRSFAKAYGAAPNDIRVAPEPAHSEHASMS